MYYLFYFCVTNLIEDFPLNNNICFAENLLLVTIEDSLQNIQQTIWWMYDKYTEWRNFLLEKFWSTDFHTFSKKTKKKSVESQKMSSF